MARTLEGIADELDELSGEGKVIGPDGSEPTKHLKLELSGRNPAPERKASVVSAGTSGHDWAG